MANDASNRRRTRVVLKDMQGRLMLQTTVLPLGALAALTIAVTVLCRRVLAEAAEFEIAMPHVELLLITVLCLTSAMAGAILYVAFRFSHRVAGPSYRIIQSLKQAQTGDLAARTKLRDGDFLTEVADQLNETLATLQQQADGGGSEGGAADEVGVEREPVEAGAAE